MEEGKRNVFLKFGLIEIGFLVIIILVILGILYFMNALPFSKEVQKLSRDSKQNAATIPPVTPTNVITVSVESDDSKYTVSIQNSKKLSEILNSWQLNLKRVYEKNDQIPSSKQLQKIVVILTSQKQERDLLLNSSQRPYLSYATSQSGDTIQLKVWVDEKTLQDAPTPQEKGKYLDYAFFSVFYNLATSDKILPEDKREEEFRKKLAEFGTNNYFIVTPR
jgi:hypothetical protein